jgi:hypothetical protein
MYTVMNLRGLAECLSSSCEANSIARTRTISSAAWEPIWSVTHVKAKLQHVETCLDTTICLTQHPSDNLWQFRELD